MNSSHAIGVFDSGVGGLTVLRALTELLPHENFIYLGDTARLPYGTKSAETVSQYALQAVKLLMTEPVKLIVIACNTASALALPTLTQTLSPMPCLDVITPGAEEAATCSRTGRIAVLATESTVRSKAYETAIRSFRTDAHVKTLACNLLVALAEEGWCEGKEAEAIIKRYLDELGDGFDTIVLGCTHFPLLTATLRKLLPPHIVIINSAATTAQSVQRHLKSRHLNHTQSTPGARRFLVTDAPERFTHMAKRLLNTDIAGTVTFAYLSP
ncbi:MAG: glutamate racemase [Alphaproteobacteria bacterium]